MRQKLTHLELTGFRNYESLKLDLDADIVFFIGKNGAGKTTILEAIGVAAILRSFRGGNDRDLIRFGSEYYTAKVYYTTQNSSHHQHVAFGNSPAENGEKPTRRMSLNGEKILRSAEYIGRLQTVFFSPHDISIIDSGPANRRRFLDMQISTLFPGYYEALQHYNRTLKRRSALLKEGVKNALYLEAYDKELTEYGLYIHTKRQDFLKRFQVPFGKYIRLISGGNDYWEIRYIPSILASSKNEYLQALKKNIEKDIRYKHTTLGIHRDQILFVGNPSLEKYDLSKIASQGQKRTAALSLKMAQYELTRDIKKENPVLLIDDVFNELDEDRRNHFVEFLQEIGQALITTTEIHSLEQYLLERKNLKAYVYKIENGKVLRVDPAAAKRDV